MADDDVEIDLENWMSMLPESIRVSPFIYLAIPGSHDSMTYSLTRNSDIAPDSPPIVRQLWPMFKGTIVRWTKTQDIDVNQQLHSGIRYFDLRLATKDGTRNIFFTHGLYADEITEPLKQIKEFLDSHPNEVIILDCQHFYDFQMDDHRHLFAILINTYGTRICPPQRDLELITLDSMNKRKQQVIIVYRNDVVVSTARFWRNGQLPTPWPRQVNTQGLLRWMANVHRPPSAGFVLQSVLTPTTAFIVFRWRSNIKDSCAKPIVKKVLPWIENLTPGRPPPVPSTDTIRVNVVIADFINYNEYLFPKTIVRLNYKLI